MSDQRILLFLNVTITQATKIQWTLKYKRKHADPFPFH